MIVLRYALVVIVAFVLSSYSVVPAEDLPETTYDESESLPFETTPVLCVVSQIIRQAPLKSTRLARFRKNSITSHGKQRTSLGYSASNVLTSPLLSLRC